VFWFVILIVLLLVIGSAVFIGTMLNRRRSPSSDQRRKLNMAKASGAFSHRKSNQ
jgi:hypothetical protein